MAEHPHFLIGPQPELLSPASLKIITKGYLNKHDATKANFVLEQKINQYQNCYIYRKMTTSELIDKSITINIGIASKNKIQKGNYI